MMLRVLFNFKTSPLAEDVLKLNNTWQQNVWSIIKYFTAGIVIFFVAIILSYNDDSNNGDITSDGRFNNENRTCWV